MDIHRTLPALVTLLKTERKHGKDYSFASQPKILENMDKYQGVLRCLRTIGYWLADLQAGKYIICRRRIKKHKEYGMVFHSTLRKITIKGYRLMASMGVDVVKEIRKYMRWLNEKSQRPKKRIEPTSEQVTAMFEADRLAEGCP
jgi:hypothetical protein